MRWLVKQADAWVLACTHAALHSAPAAMSRARGWLRLQPRAVKRGGVVLLATTGVAAFGIAPMAPDAAALPTKWVVEQASTVDLNNQREALARHMMASATPWHRSTETRASDTAATLLKRLGVLDAEALYVMRNDPQARKLLEGRVGKRVQARADAQGQLIELVAHMPALDSSRMGTEFTRLSVKRHDGGVQARTEQVPLAKDTRFASGTIRTSLFEATDAARVPDAIAIQIAEIFASEIDFQRELRKGDSFRVVYEALMADGEPIAWSEGSGKVLAVEFINKGQKHEAAWFNTSADRGEYYDFQGQSRRRAFLASPLEFSRVTSGFKMRFHPVLKSWRQHLGTDYAAPKGTPVRVVGDGSVEFAGVQKGYGNVIIVKHSQNRQTLYAHLSRLDVKVGQRVDQGKTIGAVGSTGWSTGPHLHFEFKVAGTHQDPLVIAKTSESVPMPTNLRGAFQAQVAAYTHRLSVAQTLASQSRARAE